MDTDFFKKLEKEIKDKVTDMVTIEHAMIANDGQKKTLMIYRKQQLDGDSVCFVADEPIAPEVVELFNNSFSASMIARTAIADFLIKILIK